MALSDSIRRRPHAMTHPGCLLLAATAAAAAAAAGRHHPPMADVGVVPAFQRGHHARARADAIPRESGTSVKSLGGTRPNVVIFFADDFGWGDLASYGHPTQESGNIDAMAAQGLRFTQWYSAESICTPSRMGLMTGRMPTRMGMVHSVFGPNSGQHLPTEDLTIAEMVKPLGYATGYGGKWHLGHNDKTKTDGLHLPYYRGFEETGHIIPFSNHWACDESGRHSPKPGADPETDKVRNATCYVFKNTTLVEQPIYHHTLTERIVDDARDFIAKSTTAKIPFLWVHAFPQCHVSMFTNTSFTNTSANGIFGDQIREMDWAVGQVVETVQTHAALNHTIFFFSSDHGPHVELCLEGGTAAHLRGGKGDSSWEGGLRVPGIIYWPGMVAPAVSAAPVSTLDVFATVVELAGGAMPTDKVMDGRSLLPLMTGANATSPHEALFHYCGSTLMAIRYKNWKLRYYTEQLPFDNYSTVHCTNGWAHAEFFQGGWTCHGGSVTTNDPPELINIGNDPSERYPLLPTGYWPGGDIDDDVTATGLGGVWQEHKAYLEATEPVDSLLRSFQHYREIGALAAPPTMRSSQCGDNMTVRPGCILDGYSGASLPSGTPADQLVAACEKRCCDESSCGGFVLQRYSKNSGEPAGACVGGRPCCWLVRGDEATRPCTSNDANVTAGVLRPRPPKPGPSPAPVPPTGLYADVLREIDAILARHLAGMVRGSIPGDRSAGDLTPCGGTVPEVCTVGYPGA